MKTIYALLLMCLCSPVFAAGELKASYSTGSNLYTVVVSATGTAWNTVTPAFEAIQNANWANYAVSYTEQGTTGLYLATFPAGIVTLGTYNAYTYIRLGSTAAVGDTLLGTASLDWSGSAMLSNATGISNTSTILTRLGTPVGATFSADIAAIVTSLLATVIDGTMTFKQMELMSFICNAGKFAVTRTTAYPWTITVRYYRADGTTVAGTRVTTYTDGTFSKAASSIFTLGTLP